MQSVSNAPCPQFLIDSMSSLVAYIDSSCRYRLCNQAYLSWLGADLDAVVGRTISDVLGEEFYQRIRVYVEAALSGKAVKYERWADFGPKDRRYVEVHYSPYLDSDGQVAGFVTLVHDNTEKRLALDNLKKMSENLRRSNEGLVDVLESMTSSFFALDSEWRFLHVNSNFERAMEKPRDEILGQNFWTIFPHARDTIYETSYRRAMGDRVSLVFEGYYEPLRLWTSTSVQPTKDGGIAVFFHDISLGKIAQAELKRSENRFRELAESIAQMVWVVDRNRKPEYFNRLWTKYTGVSSEMGESWAHLIHPADREKVEEEWFNAINAKMPFHTECRIRGQQSNQYRWFNVHAVPSINECGDILRWFGTCTDIDSQKLMTLALEKSESQFRTMANSIPLLAWMTDPDGQTTWLNDRWEDYTGMSPQEILVHGWERFLDPNTLDRTLERWKESLRTGHPYEDVYRLRSKTGEMRWFLSRASPIRNLSGAITGWLVTNTDVSHEREIQQQMKLAKERAEEANRSKSAFLANMSHELRTPMTAVLGFSEVLKDPNLPEHERQDALARIERSGYALLRLIDDVLDISKVEAGKISIQLTRFSPIETVTEVLSLLRLQAEQKGIELQLKVKASTPQSAVSDSARVRQILTNLIGNAIKFTACGCVKVEIGGEVVNGKSYLVFSVSDTGIGMSPEDQNKIFQPFVQADESITRQYGGSGLGLVLSKRLALLLGGNLNLARSEVNKGSHFVARIEAGPFEYFQLPSTSQAIDRRPVVDTTSDGRNSLQGISVLVADDAADNQILMKRYLECLGARVELASNGEEAMAKALNGDYQLVLMDIQMPGMDGIQATRKMRALGYQGPILALTAHAMREEVDRSLSVGFDEHVVKPVSRSALISILSRHVRQGGVAQSL